MGAVRSPRLGVDEQPSLTPGKCRESQDAGHRLRLPLHLKTLSLIGFKSFADRTRLDFERGVNVIVGPNGSGKSNIVDAISWVMGTQATTTLRTSRTPGASMPALRGMCLHYINHHICQPFTQPRRTYIIPIGYFAVSKQYC